MSVPVNSQKTLLLKRGYKFKLEPEDKPRINLKHPAYYTLLWIACVDDYCNLHYILKAKVSKYPKRMEWNNSKKRFQNAKVMHKWHLLAIQYSGYLSVELRRFMTEEYLNGYQWWECIENHCPQHVQDKVNKKYQPKIK